jgi:3-oxoacyl-[acyl-carrier protein] reductase
MGPPALHGKTAVVTGASRGLGLEIARQLAWAESHLALVARDGAALELAAEKVRSELTAPGVQQVHTCVADLSSDEQIDAAFAAIKRALGSVDILVNNAAVQGPIGPFESADWLAWRDVFQVDLFAPARLSRHAIPGMRGRGWGKIINVSGGGATTPRPDFSAYASAKTALVRFTETLAEELKGTGVDVNAVAPGPMNTRMLDETIAAGPGRASREHAAAVERAKSNGVPPEKAADLVYWLASPASDGITGRLISAVWDDWQKLAERRDKLAATDVYTLRRIIPKDRGLPW